MVVIFSITRMGYFEKYTVQLRMTFADCPFGVGPHRGTHKGRHANLYLRINLYEVMTIGYLLLLL